MRSPITVILLTVNVLFFITTYVYEDVIYEFALVPIDIVRNPFSF